MYLQNTKNKMKPKKKKESNPKMSKVICPHCFTGEMSQMSETLNKRTTIN